MAAPIVFGFLISFPALSQTPSQTTFEVASIKVAPPPEQGRGFSSRRQGGPGTPDPELYSCSNCPFLTLIQQAFDLPYYQIAGIDGVGDHLYDVSARVPAGASKAQFLEMYQNLLVERFKLASHRETKPVPAYELSVGKGGPKMKKSAATGRGGTRISFEGATMAFHAEGESMGGLTQMMSSTLRAPVVDATGLTDRYDFELKWDAGNSAALPAPNNDAAPLDTLFGAVQSQLGLKLDHKTAPLQVLVVDHYEKTPTAN
jgi:uncharacterized protein (TIGR03435 family)